MTTARPFLSIAAAILAGVALTSFAWYAVASEARPASRRRPKPPPPPSPTP